MYLTFHGKERFVVVHDHGHGHGHDDHAHADHDDHHHVSHKDDHGHHEQGIMHETPKESPWVVTLPLILLAIPSVIVGFLAIQPMLYGEWFGSAIHVNEANNVLGELAKEFHGSVAMALHGFLQLPFLLVLTAFAIQTYIYLFNPSLADRIKNALKPIYNVLNHKYWFDAVYYIVFARGGMALGRALWKGGDAAVIDGVMVNGSANLVDRIAGGMRRLQSGYLYHYAFAMILGLILLLGGYWLVGQ
jgi:NADH-quinone oxidoreductase subunit L